MARVFILNGVNLGTLGTRRPEVYGTTTLDDIERLVSDDFPDVDLEFRQTDFEGEMVGFIRETADSDGLIINAGAWTTTPTPCTMRSRLWMYRRSRSIYPTCTGVRVGDGSP